MTEPARATLPRSRHWPMTSAARDALVAEIDRLVADIARDTTAEPVDEDDVLVRLPVAHAGRRLDALRAILADAVFDEDPDTIAIGDRVTLRDPDGSTETYALVIPGDGDPSQGWVSADSPLGSAVIGRRAGDRADVAAPGGSWQVTIVAVE